jgi:drug/metabolite transporter (DMT)-like permease
MSIPPARLYRALVYMFAMGAIWGAQFSLAKIGMQEGIAPASWTIFVCVTAAIALLAIAGWRGVRMADLIPHTRYAILAGATSVAIPNTVMAIVVGHVPAGVASMLNTLSPVMTYAMALGFAMDKFHPLRVAGIGCGLIGTLLILGPRASLPDPAMIPWVALNLLVPFFYALSNIYVARARPAGVDSIALAGVMQLGSVASLLPLALWQGIHIPIPPAHAGDWALLALAAMYWISSLLFFEVMRLAGPVFFSQTGFISTIFGVFWGWLFFGETHSLYIWGAMAAILAGLALVTRAGRS